MSGNREVFEHFKSVLDDMIHNHPFWAFYFQNPYSLDCDTMAGSNVEMHCGASRGCLIDSNYEWVVKWNLTDSGYDENYCEIESEIYENAVAAGLGESFAAVQYAGTYRTKVRTWTQSSIFDVDDGDWYFDGTDEDFLNFINRYGFTDDDMEEVEIEVPLWQAVKAQTAFNMDYSEADEEYASQHQSPLSERSTEIGGMFVADYGADWYDALTHFLNEWNVNDIHFGNIGFMSKRVILIDYAGYHY